MVNVTRAQPDKIQAVEFPVMTTTQSDEIDPSLPRSQAKPPPAPAAEAVPISGDVAAELARQLGEAQPANGAAPSRHRIYAQRQPSGSMLPGERVDPLARRPRVAPASHEVDETAVLNRMMDMNRGQVMRGVEDAVRRTNGLPPPKRVSSAHHGSARIEAQRLNPASGNGMRRIDPDPPAAR